MTDMREPDWKLKLRYGKLKTNFEHFTLIADGKIVTSNSDYETQVGPAVMSMKIWASGHDEAFEMIRVIGGHLGFSVAGKIELYETDPSDPPGEHPHGYDISFTAYDD